MERLHQLSEAKLHNEEGSLPSTVYQPNPELTSRIKLFCFLDEYSGYNQIVIHPDNQEKTTFACPFGTFAFKLMPFGLCNTPATFQRCMTTIFSNFLADNLEVFMEDFSIIGDDFDNCLAHLTKILEVCVTKRLVLSDNMLYLHHKT